MKNSIALFTFLVFFASCNSNKVTKPKRKIDPALEALATKYPNYKNNSAVRQDLIDDLASELDSLLRGDVLSDIPLKVMAIKESPNPKNPGMLVQFYTPEELKDTVGAPSDNLKFDVLGFLPQTVGKTINENATYYIKGHNYQRLNAEQTQLLTNVTFYSPEVSIGKSNNFSSDEYDYRIGILMAEIDSVIELK